jgi:release factor glutamine methyltransferase
VTLDAALKQGAEQLSAAQVPSPRLNAEVLLMHAARCDRAYLYAHGERELTDSERAQYVQCLKERSQGKPAQYITGRQEFWGLDFLVNPSVLIPRPETELAVETALELIRQRSPDGAGMTIADVGTGSGCIAIALAKELPQARLIAMDQSKEALATAQENARRLGVESRISFLHSDLLAPRSGESLPPVQFVVSNPPYVSERDMDDVMREVRRWEPPAAVFAGESGLEIYARLIPQAAAAMADGGQMVLELGYDIREGVRRLLEPGSWTDIAWRKDLAGIVRVVSARRIRTVSAPTP